MGRDHPIAWSQPVGRGRAFFTALGHAGAAYATRAMRRHLGGAIVWAARRLARRPPPLSRGPRPAAGPAGGQGGARGRVRAFPSADAGNARRGGYWCPEAEIVDRSPRAAS